MAGPAAAIGQVMGKGAGAAGKSATSAGAAKGGGPRAQMDADAMAQVQQLVSTGVQLGTIAAGEMAPSVRKSRKDLFRRYAQMGRGQLGMSEAEKAQKLSAAASQIQAQQAAQQANLNQQAAAAGGAGRAGSNLLAQQQMQAAAAQGLGAAAGGIEQASTLQAQQAQADIRAAMERQAEAARATWQRVGNVLKGGADNVDMSKLTKSDRERLDAVLRRSAGSDISVTGK